MASRQEPSIDGMIGNMNWIVEHAGKATLAVVTAALFAGAGLVLPAQAQQAKKEGTRAQQTDRAPVPVTPFGPRRKPPRTIPRQPAVAKLPKPEIVSTHGSWRVVCEKLPVAKKGDEIVTQKVCYVSAAARDPKRKNVFVIINILAVKDKKGKVTGYMVNLRAPLGVFLPTGIALEVDGKAVSRVPFSRCNQIFCESTGQARKETLARLKKGRKAKFIIYAAPGVGLPVELDLKGFSAAMKKLSSLK